MYKTNINLRNVENIDDFLADLNIEINFKILNLDSKELIERASQMTMKTNQFNMTTKRYSISEIENIVKDNKNQVIMMFVKDKFGDNGSSGLVILKENFVDTFLLSCRVLKRKLEYCMLDFAKNRVKKYLNNDEVFASYIETDKNKAFKDFYKEAGMINIEKNIYKIGVQEPINNLPNFIKINY